MNRPIKKINLKTPLDKPVVSFPKPGKKKKKSALQKRKDKPNSSYWKKKADKAWGECIHTIYLGCAIGEDCAGPLEAHHLISRSHVLTRHSRTNGILLCSKHHKHCIKLSPHGGPVGFVAWLQENMPEKYQFVLDNKYLTGQKPDYKARYEELRIVIDALNDLDKRLDNE